MAEITQIASVALTTAALMAPIGGALNLVSSLAFRISLPTVAALSSNAFAGTCGILAVFALKRQEDDEERIEVLLVAGSVAAVAGLYFTGFAPGLCLYGGALFSLSITALNWLA